MQPQQCVTVEEHKGIRHHRRQDTGKYLGSLESGLIPSEDVRFGVTHSASRLTIVVRPKL